MVVRGSGRSGGRNQRWRSEAVGARCGSTRPRANRETGSQTSQPGRGACAADVTNVTRRPQKRETSGFYRPRNRPASDLRGGCPCEEDRWPPRPSPLTGSLETEQHPGSSTLRAAGSPTGTPRTPRSGRARAHDRPPQPDLVDLRRAPRLLGLGAVESIVVRGPAAAPASRFAARPAVLAGRGAQPGRRDPAAALHVRRADLRRPQLDGGLRPAARDPVRAAGLGASATRRRRSACCCSSRPPPASAAATSRRR